ncbi:MAG: endonuclease/exonuclease/phosphatase family protein [Deltaproteobacteria bacterium]
MPRFRAAGACAACVLLLGCSDRDVLLVAAGGPSESSAANGPLSLASFNAAIGVGLAPHAPERLDAIERDLPSLGADVLCLQELWQPEDLERIAAALASEYPYNHRSVQARGGGAGAACTDAEATSLLDCLSEHCAAVEQAGLPLCAIASCAPVFTQVGTSCQQCVVANQAADDVNNLVQICSAGDGAAASYEDQTGLLLLSNLPLAEPDFLRLESSLGDRGVLRARLDRGAAGTLDVYCTHLAASLNQVPYTGPYGSWQGERVQQIERFLAWVEETRAPAGTTALLGDLNCGPETSRASSASPDAYARFVRAGFEDPYVESDGRCTFCANNPLNGSVTDPDEGALIDHILLSGLESGSTPTATRILDQLIEIDAGGTPVQTAHSDHYGVQVTVPGSVSSGSL